MLFSFQTIYWCFWKSNDTFCFILKYWLRWRRKTINATLAEPVKESVLFCVVLFLLGLVLKPCSCSKGKTLSIWVQGGLSTLEEDKMQYWMDVVSLWLLPSYLACVTYTEEWLLPVGGSVCHIPKIPKKTLQDSVEDTCYRTHSKYLFRVSLIVWTRFWFLDSFYARDTLP